MPWYKDIKRTGSPARPAGGVARDAAPRGSDSRQGSYREQALAMFPHVCARCGKEFAGKALRELTVHHRDNDHMNNPPDGSNWELLCLYCHDDAHDAYERTGGQRERTAYSDGGANAGFHPFAGLDKLIQPDGDEQGDTAGGQ